MASDYGASRWRERAPRDTRPIVSDYDLPLWLQILEAAAPWGCRLGFALAIGIGIYAWAIDYFAGHL